VNSTAFNPELSYWPATSHESLWDISVGDLLIKASSAVPERIAVSGVPTNERPMPARWSYRELLQRSEDVANRLLIDFRPGEHIALWAINSPEWILLQMGAALAGLVLVTLNPANRIEEMRYLLRQSSASGLLLDRTFRQLDNEVIIRALQPELPALRKVIYFDEWDAYMRGPRTAERLPTVPSDAAAMILFTSGTTGKPKGVVLTHRGVVNNARYSMKRYELDDGAVWLNVLPYFHVGGAVATTLACVVNRGTQVVMNEFKPEIMLKSIEDFKATITMCVPMMVHSMLNHERFETTDLSSLKLFVTGGSTIAPELVRVIRERFKTDVGVIFGQSEAGGSMCVTRRNDSDDNVCSTVGLPIDSYDVKIVDSVDGFVLPTGQIGQICVRSPCQMKEYFGMPEKTADALDAEGWLRSGDLGVMRPDGYVQVTGRLGDMIIRGGENIYPREIEEVLSTHPSISQVAVYGVPDDKWGEQLAAAVIFLPGLSADKATLEAFLEAKIARHKVPRQWRFVTNFPTSAIGKIQKFALKEQHSTT
jgi:fatty-acyl-CoA synthase